ncbi:putative leucine-rich repeat receptor-like serine/threonine-protein kinase At2g24130 [Ananas comosus]|uniref:non-specific serine/threonine protein kinase n=1 Tax=Ananas comosus TaxID=4615 RepID=A0A6P5EBE2_ANACO|nr:putative leucine-rich repeat receptor-like serine/threonine-protein kinase At2g24130 [Ananas comosus]
MVVKKSSLLSFKSSLPLQSQSLLSNWNVSTLVCDFVGVVCDRWRLHVVRLQLGGLLLNLSNNLLTGPIPAELSNLTALNDLNLSNNLLTGPIPAELSNLRHLVFLNLLGNQLHGPIPHSLSFLANLRFLELSSNNLTGPIPASILCNCTKLGVIDLSNNSLSGDIPADNAINLTVLVSLDLYMNNLTGKLPLWLSNSVYLHNLDVENNHLSDELPSEIIANMTLLKYLHLSDNHFSSHNNNTDLGPFFRALANCSSLIEIEMARLGLGGVLPHGAMGQLTRSLNHINLEDNMVSGPIPADISDVSNLTLLNLSSNLLNGTIPIGLGQLANLERLILSNNSLSGTIPSEIGNISAIGLLDLSENMLSGEMPSTIGDRGRLVEVHLQKNQLSGAIPTSLGKCLSLNILDLSYNRLTGSIPEEVSGIVKISLNLSHNQLVGPLPFGLSKMEQVEEIDLSSNNLSGVIIPQLSSCKELKLINFSHNSLQGKLPDSFGELRNLEALDLSFNLLSGEIPLSLNTCTNLTYLNLSYNDFSGYIPVGGIFSSFSNLSYIGNPHLCGPLSGQSCGVQRRFLHTRKFLIAIIVGAAVLAIMLTTSCFVVIRKFKERIITIKVEMFRGSSSPVMRLKYPRITYRELVEATEEFSQGRLIGSGSYGRVYRGVLRDGSIVAVKVLHLQTGNSTKSFNRECQVLKRIRHRNLMRIITACSLPDFKALVLPFMANGSLENRLYNNNNNNNSLGSNSELGLIERVSICSDVAEGMAYLHHHSPVKVIHCDLKPSNVLLNDDLTAVVSDFGISRLVMGNSNVSGGGNNNNNNVATIGENVGASTANMLCGSVGYIAPEYGYGSNLSTKGDVYSFGVMVLEVVTKKRPTDEMFEGGLSLHSWVSSHHHRGRAEAVVDPALVAMVQGETSEVRRMWEVAIGELLELGLLCTQESPSTRPTMMNAADDLDRLKRYLSGDTTATFASSLGLSSSRFDDD